MKKSLILILLALFFSFSINGQSRSANSANRNTAIRHLKLAENCLVAGDWENTLRQADLGLSYDDGISDLIYIKAAAEINLGKSKADVIKLISMSFEKNDWVGYKKNGARILYADLLCDTGRYDESLALLDNEPFIYSADAEFIRIKNYYCMGTDDAINNARLKLNSARRIYPADLRFPNIFFLFEYMILSESERLNIDYEIPEIVKTVAANYLVKLPDYSGNNTDLELLASFFADGEEQKRLVSAIDAKNQTVSPLLALAGLKTGLYTQRQAFDIYFELSENEIHYSSLAILCKNITEPEVKNLMMDKMLNFTGTMYFDENFDLQNELVVDYELGRPQYIKYDRNNDGVTDLYLNCDFGVPDFAYYDRGKVQIYYDSYPEVQKISYTEKQYDYNFLHNDYLFTPVEMTLELELSKLGLDFYIPVVKKDFYLPDYKDLLQFTASVDFPVNERLNGKIQYKTMNGKFIYADFYENDNKYAYCDFTAGLPLVRHVDYDNDGYYETLEHYDLIDEASSLYDKNSIVNTFGNIAENTPMYLKKILIDKNGNTFFEYSEQYLEKNGKVSLWDNDDNGVWDCQYIRYPESETGSVIEETIYFDEQGQPYISINSMDGIPVKMLYDNTEVVIYSGNEDNIYWIDSDGAAELEEGVIDYINKGITQGAIDIIDYKETRISVIRVGQNVFCRVIPDSEIIPEE